MSGKYLGDFSDDNNDVATPPWEVRRTRCLSYLHAALKQSRERSEERQNLIGEIYIVKSLNSAQSFRIAASCHIDI